MVIYFKTGFKLIDFLVFLFQESYERSKALLKKHELEHKKLAKALMLFETLSKEEIADIINNKPINRNGGRVLISVS